MCNGHSKSIRTELRHQKTKETPTPTSPAWCIFYGKRDRKCSGQNQINQCI